MSLVRQVSLERQTTLSSAGSAALCDVGAAADSYGLNLPIRHLYVTVSLVRPSGSTQVRRMN